MAVFTPVTLADLQPWIGRFAVGAVQAIDGIASGIENSNFFVRTESGTYVLTLFETLSAAELPFYLQLMDHLARRGVLVPAPIADVDGEILHTLCGRPAALVSKLAGASQMQPQPLHCTAVGAMLAKMHVAARDFPLRQPNLRGIAWWRQTAPVVLPYVTTTDQQLLRDEMQVQETFAASTDYAQLPAGPIHADLFRNNVMFDGDRLSGFFDFYFAGCDHWLFDVAVTVNDWCIDQSNGSFDANRVRALLDAYHAVRPFDAAEQRVWPTMLRAAALRFWLSRLYDLHMPRAAQMLTAHDPLPFQRILQQRIAQPAPPLFMV